MGISRLKNKLSEQQAIYEALLAGDMSTVCYCAQHDEQWGVSDSHYTARLRLAYYLLYFHVDDESTVRYLFEEELIDRETNSFQGIGMTLPILTQLLRQYNGMGKYDDLFQRAKNANFDCACGYDPSGVIDDDLDALDLLDALYLCWDLDYTDVLAHLLEKWCASVTVWNEAHRRTLIEFNTYLGRLADNESLYLAQLTETLAAQTSSVSDIISRYHDVIRYYLSVNDFGQAHHYCRMVIDTTDYRQISRSRLFGDILEDHCTLIAAAPDVASDLWQWTKSALQNDHIMRYGNLYTKAIAAAEAMHDPYGEKLSQEYAAWREQIYL